MGANADTIRTGSIVSGPTLPEPIEVLATVPMGASLKVIGRGRSTGLTYDPVLTPAQLAQLTISADREPFDGDARLFRLGIEAQRLGLAYEYDPFFSLSIARVDPLPHQLEAVYSYFLRLPRIRFLLADDPGAGKTIMAGLLLKELKARGLVRRVLIVTPANLTFQWQREMAEKFREKFEVIRGDVLRANYGQNPWQERDQVVTSVSWVSVVEDARESLLRSRWDLVIVDEAHKMSARSEDRKTYAYRLGENLSKMTDHYLLMTATPHKGDPEHFRRLNLSAMIGKSAEAKERRLVPEVIEQFFTDAAPECGLRPKPAGKQSHVYRLGKVPRNLLPVGDAQDDRFGRMGREYKQIAFYKAVLRDDPTLEWVTPGHPLFEALRTDIIGRTADHLGKGAVFFDLHRSEPALLDLFAASIKDGRGRTLHRRLYAVETALSGEMKLHEPTVLLDIVPAPAGTAGPGDDIAVPDRQPVEHFLYEQALQPWGDRVAEERLGEVERVRRHVEISLNSLIDRGQRQLGEFLNRQIEGQTVAGLDGLIAQSEQHLDELNNRLESRKRELELERHSAVSDITHLGRAWIVPHPERSSPNIAPMVRDEEIERIAVEVARRHEEARGWVVESVESENRGFDLISRRPHSEDPKTFVEVRFIEVKGRAGVGVVALSENEYRTAERLKNDYWPYAAFNCAGTPELHTVQNPARLGWQPVMAVEHYRIAATTLLEGTKS